MMLTHQRETQELMLTFGERMEAWAFAMGVDDLARG
jgi:hypothetical protein